MNVNVKVIKEEIEKESSKGQPMRILLWTLLVCMVAPFALVLAQDKPGAAPAPEADPLSSYNRMMYGVLKTILVRSAEKMPEEHYGFRPAETVRTFGQIVGHVADSQYTFCSQARGEKNPSLKIEQSKTSKADLIAALEAAVAYCDPAYADLTDASAAEMVNFFGKETARLSVLTVNSIHSTEHYGNLVTYLRMKDIVPPTSEPDFMKPKK